MSDMRQLTNEEYRRYSRHLILSEVGKQGQEKLINSKVLIVGLGGLGSPAALYLNAAGVNLGLIDFDRVDEGNLQRQILFKSGDVGEYKVEVAKAYLNAQNPHTEITTYPQALSSENALDLFEQYDYILDGTDNFATRYLVNDAAVLTRKINIYGSIFRFEGQVTVYGAPDGPCYRCLFPEPPPPGEIPNCAEAGVLGVLPGQIALMQATETIKMIIEKGKSLAGRLLLFDALRMSWQEMKISKNPNCPVCGENPSITELEDYELLCGSRPQLPSGIESVNSADINEMLKQIPDITMLDVRNDHELEIASIAGALHLPLPDLPEKIDQIADYKDKPLVVFCKAGVRSISAIRILHQHGFSKLINMADGIDGWAQSVDKSIPRY